MDPDPAQLWAAGKFVPASGGTDRIADVAAASQSIGGTPQPAHPAHAEGIVADERAVIAGSDRYHRCDRANDYPGDPGGRARPAEVGWFARAGLQEEYGRDREGTDGNLAGGAPIHPEAVPGDV